MKQKKNKPDFDESEPEFLISCLDRHPDWAVIVCLVGGGQEINTGEAGISEWLNAIYNKFSKWEVYISPNLKDSEYRAVDAIGVLQEKCIVNFNPNVGFALDAAKFFGKKVEDSFQDGCGYSGVLNRHRPINFLL